jgi:L-fuconolactonase
MIIDAQVHIWPAETSARPWAPGGRAYAHRPSFTETDLLAEMDAAGVGRAVLVPPGWEGDRNDYALAAARAHPDRLAVMIRLDVTRPLGEAALTAAVTEPGVLGVRLTFTRGPARSWLSDGTADWLWPMLAARRVPLALYASGALPAVRRIALAHPDLPILLDHAGLPLGVTGPDRDAALASACELAALPNIAVKASSLPSYATDDYPFRSLHEPIRRLVDAFGPERVIWGSDLTRLPCSYRDALRLFTEAAPLTPPERALVTGGALSAWLGW